MISMSGRIPQDRSGRENIHLAEVPEQTFERVDCDSTQNKVEGMFRGYIQPNSVEVTSISDGVLDTTAMNGSFIRSPFQSERMQPSRRCFGYAKWRISTPMEYQQ
jgi:hypothetical protein